MMLRRNLLPKLRHALADTPVVLLTGARQTGKTTLVRQIAARQPQRDYFTLDDQTTLAAVQRDPVGFIAALGRPCVIDEVQRTPNLLPAIKLAVDDDRRPGRFLLTGSANVLSIPRVSESLAGRVELVQLWPLSQGEIERRREDFAAAAFAADFFLDRAGVLRPAELRQRILAGGYPDAFRRSDPRRASWFESYITTILLRDVRDLSNIATLTALPRMLRLLATRLGGLLNMSDVSRGLALPNATAIRYLALLEATYLVHPVPAWSGNLGLRLVKAPKVFLCDCGLAASLLGLTTARLAPDPSPLGPLLENFVAMELVRQRAWSSVRFELFHFRTHAGRKVDLVVESEAGQIVGVEVKSAATVAASDCAGLEALAAGAGRRFVRGIVLYTGNRTVPLGERMYAVPIVRLWNHR